MSNNNPTPSNNDPTPATKLDKILARAVAFAAVIAIPAGVYGYFSSQHDQRVTTAFAFYKSLKQDRTQADWSLLQDQWNAKAPEIKTLLAQHKQTEARLLTIGLLSDKKSRIALGEIVSLFDEVSHCAENGLCDHNTVYAMLQEPTNQFIGMYGYYITDIRNSDSRYGTGLFKTKSMDKQFDFFEWLSF